jgi:hypothetical protein
VKSRVVVAGFDTPTDVGEVTSATINFTVTANQAYNLAALDQLELQLVTADVGTSLDRSDTYNADYQAVASADTIVMNRSLLPGTDLSFTLNDVGVAHLQAGGEFVLATNYHVSGDTPPNARDGKWDTFKLGVDAATLTLETSADAFVF